MSNNQAGGTAAIWDRSRTRWLEGNANPADESGLCGHHLRYLACLDCPLTPLDPPADVVAFSYFPVPLIGRSLRQMRGAHPQAFSRLEIVATGIPEGLATSGSERRFTLWLPRVAPQQLLVEPGAGEDGNVVWSAQTSDLAASLIARYVAAMVIGHAVSYAPRRIALDYETPELRSLWSAWINRALEENGRNVIEKYLEQVLCPSVSINARLEQVAPSADVTATGGASAAEVETVRLLGVDIGGTTIKLQCFERRNSRTGHAAWLPIGEAETVSWETFEGHEGVRGRKPDWSASVADGLRDADLLAALVAQRVDREPFVAIGLALAAPVVNGVPAGVSGVLSYFQGVSKWIIEGNPLRLHELDFATAFERCFGVTTVCINDGEADILDDEDDFANARGVSLVLKTGTGVAFAVHVDGRPVGVLGETAKAVVNLCATPQSAPLDQRFPEGVVTEWCAHKSLAKLMPGPAWESVVGDDRGRWLGAQLVAAVDGTTATVASIAEDAELASLCERFVGELNALAGLQDFHAECRRLTTVPVGADPDPSCVFANLVIDQRFAIACAWVLGRWLADAMALAVDLYGADETRLAGGPLSGQTGLYVTRSSELALTAVYGFAVTSDRDESSRVKAASSGRALRLTYPPTRSAQSGPRGAAKAAFAAYLRRR